MQKPAGQLVSYSVIAVTACLYLYIPTHTTHLRRRHTVIRSWTVLIFYMWNICCNDALKHICLVCGSGTRSYTHLCNDNATLRETKQKKWKKRVCTVCNLSIFFRWCVCLCMNLPLFFFLCVRKNYPMHCHYHHIIHNKCGANMCGLCVCNNEEYIFRVWSPTCFNWFIWKSYSKIQKKIM